MLSETDFTWFSNFVEAHYFDSVEYLLQLPIVGFVHDQVIEAAFPPRHKAYVPTAKGFLSGKPFLIPNRSIPVIFHHLTNDCDYKYKWLQDQKQATEQKQRVEAEDERVEARNRELAAARS
jgi:hypothetical protein